MYRFDYQRPASRADALAACEGDARYLAGGQSLVQAMKLRMSASDRLVDLGGIDGLTGIRVEGGQAVVGAMTRHADVAASAEVRRVLPALAELAEGIGDPAVRSMGTLGGALANADPAACYPAAVLALDATLHTDRRAIAAADFFTGIYQTALEPGELLTEVAFPLPQQAAYMKLRQPASRFAIVGVFVARTAGGVRVAVTGARASVYREPALEAALSASFTPASAQAVKLGPEGLNEDLHASAAYRAAMVSTMAARAVERALAR
jgi:carbon-monoxide dehydrogenase medium subunit